MARLSGTAARALRDAAGLEAQDPKLAAFIREALERPRDYAYGGDLPLFDTWGYAAPGTNRDADPLTRSNHRAALAAFEAEGLKPDADGEGMAADGTQADFAVVHNRHWAVGRCDQVAVRLLEADGTPTKAARVAFALKEALESYPVLDEDDFSQEESDDTAQAWESWGCDAFKRALADHLGIWQGDLPPEPGPVPDPQGAGAPLLDGRTYLDLAEAMGEEVWTGPWFNGEPSFNLDRFKRALPGLPALLAQPRFAWVAEAVKKAQADAAQGA